MPKPFTLEHHTSDVLTPDEIFTPEEFEKHEDRKAFASVFDLSKWPEKLPGTPA